VVDDNRSRGDLTSPLLFLVDSTVAISRSAPGPRSFSGMERRFRRKRDVKHSIKVYVPRRRGWLCLFFLFCYAVVGLPRNTEVFVVVAAAANFHRIRIRTARRQTPVRP
jgi:hypothetical protein